MRGAFLCLAALTIACSGRSASIFDGSADGIPDLPPESQWTPCPPSVLSAKGPCVGANRCDYGGLCNPGDWCWCDLGQWVCALSSCPPPDIGPDIGPDVGPDAALLNQGEPCDPADDHCVSGLKCCVTGGGPPWIFDAAPPPPHTCITPMSDGACPPPPP